MVSAFHCLRQKRAQSHNYSGVATLYISMYVCVMCYLATRSDSPMKRSQPLVIFGINSGSLDERGRESERERC